MSEPFLAEIRLFSGNFEPRGWAFCNGQLLSIAQNTALFALLGTTYGGNGTTTFALPDLRGRAALGAGQGPGLADRQLGQQGGSEKLTAAQIPAHNHTLQAMATAGTSSDPSLKLPARSRTANYASASASTVPMAATAITGGGSANPAEAMPPYLVLNYIIALQGIFPSRN
jgi:microcystin-dependent protein